MFDALRKRINGTFKNQELDSIFNNCFFNTIDTTLTKDDNGYFIITGDIPAMWLRDSVMQVFHYLPFADDKDVKELIEGVIRKQFQLITIDSYANAFMHDENQHSQWEGKVETDHLPKIVWERKYELDSLCYPFFLSYKLFEFTKDISIFDKSFINAFDVMIETIQKERNHSQKSSYYFIRRPKVETLILKKKRGLSGLVLGQAMMLVNSTTTFQIICFWLVFYLNYLKYLFYSKTRQEKPYVIN